jgi:hypothetical protein
VLIRGTNCGIPLLTSNSDIIRFVSFAASRLNNAANYAEQCYNNTGSGTLECNKFVTKALPTTIDRNASCPFTSDICQKKEGNLRLDTGYIDSNDHFGLNAPSNQRFQWRYVMHCAPNSDERVQFQFSDNGTWVRYHYGESLVLSGENRTAVDYTYEVPSIEAQYGLRDNQVLWPDGLNFRLA